MNVVHFAAIYRTTILPLQQLDVRVPGIEIDVFQGLREFRVLHPSFRIGRENDFGRRPFFNRVKFQTNREGNYIAITAGVDVTADNVHTALDRGFALIDESVAVLSALYTSDIFDIEIFRGSIYKNGDGFINLVTKFLPELPPMQPRDVVASLNALTDESVTEKSSREKARRIGSLLSKYLATLSSYERFFFLWTALEVYPMADTSHIKPVKEMVARLTGYRFEKVEELQLGRLHGYRAKVTHAGYLPLQDAELGRTLGKMELLVRAALRELLGLDYDGSLEKLFS